MRGFIISLITAATASTIVEEIVPGSDGKGSLKKYLSYITALTILIILLSPLKNLITAIPEYVNTTASDLDYSSVEALSRVNSLIAMHIRDSIADKFSINRDEISVEIYESCGFIELKKHFGLIRSDIVDFVKTNYAIECEVVYIE